jgi:hypothetical protein
LTRHTHFQENQEFIARLLDALYKQGALEVHALHVVVAQFLGDCLDDVLPGDLRAEWEPADNKEPLALMVKGSRKVLNDQFPKGENWAFLKDLAALREHCINTAYPESDGAPTTPTQAGDGSFAFGPPPAPRNRPARDHGKQLRPLPPSRSDEESESSDSGDGEEDSDSDDSGPPPRRPRPPAAPNTGRINVAGILGRYGVTVDDCRNPKTLVKKKGFNKPEVVAALCELVTRGHAPQAPEGGAGPGASLAPVNNAAMVSELTKVMTDQSKQFCKAMVKQTGAMVDIQKGTLEHIAEQAEMNVRLVLVVNRRDAPNAIEGENHLARRAHPPSRMPLPLLVHSAPLPPAEGAQPPSSVHAGGLPRSDSGESGKKRKDPSSRFEEVEVPKKASSQERTGDKG